jgi:hypothetical protein
VLTCVACSWRVLPLKKRSLMSCAFQMLRSPTCGNVTVCWKRDPVNVERDPFILACLRPFNAVDAEKVALGNFPAARVARRDLDLAQFRHPLSRLVIELRIIRRQLIHRVADHWPQLPQGRSHVRSRPAKEAHPHRRHLRGRAPASQHSLNKAAFFDHCHALTARRYIF